MKNVLHRILTSDALTIVLLVAFFFGSASIFGLGPGGRVHSAMAEDSSAPTETDAARPASQPTSAPTTRPTSQPTTPSHE